MTKQDSRLISDSLRPIGVMHTDFDEKFGVPRQPGLVMGAQGHLSLERNETNREAIHGLEGFSHLWVIFFFDQVFGKAWSPRVRPPRLGGERSTGVFATRSPFRPNPIGLSVLKLDGVQETDDELIINFSGVDLVNGTPVLDLKPYLPYSDSLEGATVPDAFKKAWSELNVNFNEEALRQCHDIDQNEHGFSALIRGVLSQDPRPAVQRDAKKEFGISLRGYNIRFRVEKSICQVLSVSSKKDTQD
jgi:tRNA (adenine37-N6)-methyltransferase